MKLSRYFTFKPLEIAFQRAKQLSLPPLHEAAYSISAASDSATAGSDVPGVGAIASTAAAAGCGVPACRKISASANKKAKLMLLLLSLKSLEDPVSAVAKLSSNAPLVIRSISLIPSPMVYPGWSPAEIVADLYRLK